MSTEGDREPVRRPVRAPLTSRRITTCCLKRLGKALDLPTAASTDELLQMIEARLSEQGHESQNVQVVLEDGTPTSKLTLEDEGGEFLIVDPEVPIPDEVAIDGGESSLGEGEEEGGTDAIALLRAALDEAQARNTALQEESASLRSQLHKEKARVKEVWRTNCDYVAEYDQLMLEKDEEITRLKAELSELRGRHSPSSDSHSDVGSIVEPLPTPLRSSRRGRAPPIDPFTGEDKNMRFEEWIPALERASQWNGWTETDTLLQLAGHLRGKALQQWNLLSTEDKSSLKCAIEALKNRLDPGSQVLAAQEFRHLSQQERETVNDFITRLEKTFRVAYGREDISEETRCAFLYAQMQEGLHYDLVQAPAVSGAQSYPQLCVAAKNEERRLAALKKRQQLHTTKSPAKFTKPAQSGSDGVKSKPSKPPGEVRCFQCGKLGHIAKHCRVKKSKSRGNSDASRKFVTKQVVTKEIPSSVQKEGDDPLTYLHSSDDSEDEASIRQIRVTDTGSRAQLAKVTVQGIPAEGVVDSGADITIMGGALFKRVASLAKLKKRNFMQADKTPRTYDMRPFSLDGRMDLDIAFEGRTMTTPIYLKMDATTPLLLSEGVCRQLHILKYHPSIAEGEGTEEQPLSEAQPHSQDEAVATIPMVRVRLLQSTRFLPQTMTAVTVEVDGVACDSPHLIEPSPEIESCGLHFEETVIPPDVTRVQLLVSNRTGFTQRLESGDDLGDAEPVDICPSMQAVPMEEEPARVQQLKSEMSDTERGQKLVAMYCADLEIPDYEKAVLCDFLAHYHAAFCLQEGERGETDLVQLHINTGDAKPIKQAPRRTPFAVRREVDRQVKQMEEAGIIQKAYGAWSSPVILVKKKNGTYRFCVDYRKLNEVTEKDTFPLPRIDDLLDQLGQAKYFSTLDLAAGYWQIKVAPESKAKTAFVTHRGLFEFNVMPFGLTNAPAVFQRLVQEVLSDLNPEEGPDFVSAYIDDIIVFSRSLEEHITHLRLVLDCLMEAGLKLNPEKCRFIMQQVEYLGYVVTPQGLKPSTKHVQTVVDFPVPTNLSEVRRFLGLASYYRRFVHSFAKIAKPLHALTKKDTPFNWSADCQSAFELLKQKLVEAPILAYPTFNREFVLETDASQNGLGVVLAQVQDDDSVHPIAYASRALSQSEKNYGITDLETLAVVWALSHFRTYLYGQKVKVITDHSAVKSVLLNPTASGKHARWWAKVFKSGIGEVDIHYRRGSENVAADALSRAPLEGFPDDEETLGVAVCLIDEGTEEIEELLKTDVTTASTVHSTLGEEQQKDPLVREMVEFIESGVLPSDDSRARKITLRADQFTVIDGILYFIDCKQKQQKRAVVPCELRPTILKLNHSGSLSGHLSGPRLYRALSSSFWWDGMYRDVVNFCRNCPQCVTVTGGERVGRPPLQSIPVQRPFQVVGVDVMDLPKTEMGNKHVLVFQDFLTKWPVVFPLPDQKTHRLVEILVKEIVPTFGVPESLLSDRGTNLLSFLMRDVCDLLGIAKLNTTAYHPQCNGMVERFNRTLKMMLRKHVEVYGKQWDQHLHAVLWAYRNTPHESTNEKPSFLLFGKDLRTPTDAAFLPPTDIQLSDVSTYREELVADLTLARENAAKTIQKAQARHKKYYDKKTSPNNLQNSEWIMIRFPQEETGAERKLSRPWHGPYRVVDTSPTGVTATKVYAPQDGTIQVHLNRVSRCPPQFPAGYYWYGSRRKGPGRPPKMSFEQKRTPQDSTSETTTPEISHDESEEEEAPVVSATSRRTKTRLVKPPDRLM